MFNHQLRSILSLSKSLSRLGSRQQTTGNAILEKYLSDQENIHPKSRKTMKVKSNIGYFRVLGSSSLGNTATLLVRSEDSCYLFNCPEGFQRLAIDSKQRIATISNVFMTSNSWTKVAGLHGLSLSAQTSGNLSLSVHGTGVLDGFFDCTKGFIQYSKDGSLNTITISTNPYEDDNIKITPIPIYPSQDLDIHADKKVKSSSKLIAYYGEMPDFVGSLNVSNCKKLKVPIGPLLAKLKAGEDVTLEDGRIVKSSEVCEPSTRGPSFIVVDCPSIGELSDLKGNTELDRMSKGGNPLDYVFHIGPTEVVADPTYRQWTESFREETQHFIVQNSSSKIPRYISNYRLHHVLRTLDPQLFPHLTLPDPIEELILEESKQEKTEKKDEMSYDDNAECYMQTVGQLSHLGRVVQLDSLDLLSVRTRKTLDSALARIDIDLIEKELSINTLYNDELDDLRAAQGRLRKPEAFEPEVVFLGTGSSSPNLYRNVSAILLNFYHPNRVSIILDCGEDTYGQLVRHYGLSAAKDILKHLKLVYISHHHADHHLGLSTLIIQRAKLTKVPAIILTPPNPPNVLDIAVHMDPTIRDSFEIFDMEPCKYPPNQRTIVLRDRLSARLDGFLSDISFVRVNHCLNSFAVVMEFKINHPKMDSFKICYSGDTIPSSDFAQAGRDCDLLIHEATFDDRFEEDAKWKKHSTTSQAIHVGQMMKAKFTILTHFSQRYPKIPLFTDAFNDKVGFAFDHMQVRCPTDFARIPILKPVLNTAFSESLKSTKAPPKKYDLKFKEHGSATDSSHQCLSSEPT